MFAALPKLYSKSPVRNSKLCLSRCKTAVSWWIARLGTVHGCLLRNMTVLLSGPRYTVIKPAKLKWPSRNDGHNLCQGRTPHSSSILWRSESCGTGRPMNILQLEPHDLLMLTGDHNTNMFGSTAAQTVMGYWIDQTSAGRPSISRRSWMGKRLP